MLAPKKVKWRKMQKGRRGGTAWRGSSLAFGDFGLQALDRAWLTAREIEAARVALTRAIKRERETRDLPIIMLTARAAEADKVAGLDGGADDYLTKPFSPRELVARVNALLRRSGGPEAGEALKLGKLSIDRAGHRVSAAGTPVVVGPTEYRLLEFFMLHRDRVYSREQLLDRVRGGNVYVEERTIDVHIRRLRKALEQHDCDQYIQTVRGAGYRCSERLDG